MAEENHKGQLYQFRNCRILWNHKIIHEDLWVRNGKICNPEQIFFDEKIQADKQIDCNDLIIAPGFIDVQINGAFGIDFTLPSQTIEDDVCQVSRGLLQHGVTAYCPTIITSSKDDYKQVIPKIKRRRGGKHGATILGLHLEGPFISKEKKGAHQETLIQELCNGPQTVNDMYGCLKDVSIVTLAPELDHAMEVIRNLTQREIVVSVGHSTANLSQGESAVEAGATFITHLFNAMLPFHHRDPHLVGLLASSRIPDNQTIFYGIITDGVHTDAAALKIAHRTHPNGIVIVTDAVPVMGFSSGTHHFGHQKIHIDGKYATIAGTDTLCGSISSMAECVRYFYKATECSKVEAIEAATLHPAQLLGITKVKGTLNYHSDADFIMLDDKLNVQATYIAGEKVWPYS